MKENKREDAYGTDCAMAQANNVSTGWKSGYRPSVARGLEGIGEVAQRRLIACYA